MKPGVERCTRLLWGTQPSGPGVQGKVRGLRALEAGSPGVSCLHPPNFRWARREWVQVCVLGLGVGSEMVMIPLWLFPSALRSVPMHPIRWTQQEARGLESSPHRTQSQAEGKKQTFHGDETRFKGIYTILWCGHPYPVYLPYFRSLVKLIRI